MKRFILYRILKQTHGLPFLGVFLIVYLAGSILLWMFDSNLGSVAEGLWLGFNIVTSIGLGDFTVTSVIARLTAVIMGLYGNLIVAFIPSLVASYYLEKIQEIRSKTFETYKKELSSLSSLTPEERKELAEKIHAQNHVFSSKSLRKGQSEDQDRIVKSLEIFGVIFKQTHLLHFAAGFLVMFVLCGFLIYLFDPSITTLYNAYWFAFTIVTTIGFGDFTVVHWASRIVTVILGIYGIFIIDFICGVIASYFFDVIHAGGRESISQMLWKFEHLDQLNESEIEALDNQIKQQQLKKEKNNV